MSEITIRRGELSDLAVIAEYNVAMASETEATVLDPDTVKAGVKALIEQPGLGFYLVAEMDHQVVGTLLVTTEWSDWRNGAYWWIQSVYVAPAFRRRGIYRQLYEQVKTLSNEANVCGYRLYVERDNQVAQNTYRSQGMRESHYLIFEDLLR